MEVVNMKPDWDFASRSKMMGLCAIGLEFNIG